VSTNRHLHFGPMVAVHSRLHFRNLAADPRRDVPMLHGMSYIRRLNQVLYHNSRLAIWALFTTAFFLFAVWSKYLVLSTTTKGSQILINDISCREGIDNELHLIIPPGCLSSKVGTNSAGNEASHANGWQLPYPTMLGHWL
jgi:hypothetical protein